MNRLSSGAVKSGSCTERPPPAVFVLWAAGCFSAGTSVFATLADGESAETTRASAEMCCREMEAAELAPAALECAWLFVRGQASTTLDRHAMLGLVAHIPAWCPREAVARPAVSTATNTAAGLASNVPPAFAKAFGFMPSPPAVPRP